MNIKVLPPDINESFADFTVVKNSETGAEEIRFGLNTIKNFGEGISNEIIKERKNAGPFKSLEDLITRINSRNFNKKSLEALTKTGALDKLCDRFEVLSNLEEILAYNKELHKSSKQQNSLFSDSNLVEAPKLKLEKKETTSNDQILLWEKEYLGLYISGHPLEKYKNKFDGVNFNISKIKKDSPVQSVVKLIGLVDDVRIVTTKKGDQMAFVKITDLNDSAESVFFPEIFQKNREILNKGECVIIKGSVSDRNGEFSIIAEKIARLSDVVK